VGFKHMDKKNIENIYPLSPTQQGILFHTLYSSQSGVYVSQFCCTIDDSINISALEQAWQLVVARHQVLRTSFHWERCEQPFQVVYRQVKLPWEQSDWGNISSEEQQESLKNFLEADRCRGFELKKPPLIRITLIQLAENNYQFVWTFHHLILDGWSTALVLEEAFNAYKAIHQGLNLSWTPSRPYGDYIAWLQQQDLSVAEEFWRERLKGFTMPTSLEVDRNVGDTRSHEESYDEQEIQLSEATTTALKSLAQQHQLTLNTFMQGAFALLLSRYSGEEDVVFGGTCSGRPADLEGVESMVGLFINTLPVRALVAPQESLLPWLKKLQAQQVEAQQYEYSPLVEIQAWSDVPRGTPLFESILVFENYPVDTSLSKQGETLGIRKVSSFESTNYPLTVVARASSEFSIKIGYNRHRFEAEAITRMLGHLRTLLERMISNPYQYLENLQLLTESELHQLLMEWNDSQTDYSKDKCIHELFEVQVEQTPDAIAVVFENQQLTYRELNQRANQLANHLQKLGVEPEVLVGICVERSLEMLVGLLGILKAGGAYVPLDPDYPQDRLAFMLEDAQVPVLLTQARLVETLPPHQAQVICLDTDWEVSAELRQENSASGVITNNIAYVIYTSGSTGKPKGVMNAHLGICNRLLWMQDAYQLTETDRVLQKTPFSFDVSVWEFFWPLLNGARLVVAQPGGHQDSSYLVKLIASQQITTLHFVPSMLRVFLEEEGLEACNSLGRVICSGETLPFALQERFFAHLDAELHNLYGPTEAAIDVTFWHCQRQSNLSNVPIGRPIANTQIYLLNSEGQPVPVGVPGELYIGGDQLARGYLNRPELTSEKFIPDLFSNQAGARLYKTGDLARYLPDGNIEFLGRIDHQVKVRGFRIELGEIEAVLVQHSAVQASVVVVREEKSGFKRLVAYVVLQSEQALATTELRHFLEEKLPNYMVPSAFVMLEALPLTPNGKVDRRSLPAPDLTQLQPYATFIAPSTPTEEMLAGIWREVLGVEKVGIHDNFFELGGHSLLATRVISQLRKVFQVELPLKYLFESPTIAGLAERIETKMRAGQQLEAPPILPIPRDRNLPLSFAQQRLWFLEQLETNSTAYNIPAAVRLTGSLNIAALEQSLNEIVRRHEALRTTFTAVDGQPAQVIAPTLTLRLPIVDLQELLEAEREAEVLRLATQEAQLPFDLAQGPLLRGTLLKLGEVKHIMLFTMHHIVSDGWSMGILVREVAALYEAFSNGQLSPLPKLPIQYADYALWERQWLEGEVLSSQLAYWKQQLENLPVLQLPTDCPRPTVQTFQGARESVVLSKPLTGALKTLSTKEGVTLFMTLLAAFVTLMHWYTGQDDIVVGTDVANRNRAETEGLIGFFVNQLVLRTYTGGNPTFRELLRRVSEVTLGAYAHQDLPFNKLVEVLNPERELSRKPLFQVKFILQNVPIPPLEIADLTLSPLKIEHETAEFDLLLIVEDTEQGLMGTLKYNTDLFDATTIVQMLNDFKTLLLEIAAQPEAKLGELKDILVEADKQRRLTKEQEYQKAIQQKFTSIKYRYTKHRSSHRF